MNENGVGVSTNIEIALTGAHNYVFFQNRSATDRACAPLDSCIGLLSESNLHSTKN
jgi:hypothetical protein